MGQIITLPVRATHGPACTAELDTAEPVLFAAVRRWVLLVANQRWVLLVASRRWMSFVAIRRWVEACRRGEDPIPGLCQALGTAGAHDAAFSLDGLMSMVAWVVRPSVHAHGARAPNVPHDERQLLHAINLARSGDPHVVPRAVTEPVSGVTR
jgi:hypothetical protein